MQIKELTLLTDDIQETTNFYKKVLGFTVLEEKDASVTFSVGQTKLIFHQTDTQKPNYHFAFNIPSNQIAEALDWIKEKVPVLDVIPNEKIADFKNWEAKAFYFLDNSGNVVEFIARFALNVESNTEFSGQSIFSVSEIGLVTGNVLQTCDDLIKRFNVNYFFRQEPSPGFSVLGNDEGLFIVVPENRPWYPTGIPSSKHTVSILFRTGDGKKNTLVF